MLFNNKLTGRIPKLNNLLNIDKIRLENNNLTGSIPAISNLSKLKLIYLNEVRGSLLHFIVIIKIYQGIYISNIMKNLNLQKQKIMLKLQLYITIMDTEKKRIVSYKKDTNYIEIPDHNYKISIYQVRIERYKYYFY